METTLNLSEEIKSILAQKINEFIADSVIRVNCKRLGLDHEKIEMSSLDELADKIGVSLFLFLSEEETAEIVAKIKEIKKKDNG
jgi:hypothetical protein